MRAFRASAACDGLSTPGAEVRRADKAERFSIPAFSLLRFNAIGSKRGLSPPHRNGSATGGWLELVCDPSVEAAAGGRLRAVA